MARKPKKDKAAETPAAEETAAQTTRFPLFYTAPRPLEASRHAKTSLAENLDGGFSESANAIPLNIVEFAVAARH